MIKEDFLYYLWKSRSFYQKELLDQNGTPIEIINWGTQNSDSGPDFSGGRIRVGTEEWAGNIEMHVRSSDWDKHGHQRDDAYNSVILHVVWIDDQVVLNKAGNPIPTVTLQHRTSRRLYDQYIRLHSSPSRPCSSALSQVHPLRFRLWTERVFVERMQEKTKQIDDILHYCHSDWEEGLYHMISQYLGLTKNKLPFLLLARTLPLTTLLKYSDNPFQVEALLYGQAGMLHERLQDPYPRRLLKEYQFLRHKHQLSPIKTESWKFLRMRPVSFPTLRIAQLAQIIHLNVPLARKVLETEALTDLRSHFRVTASKYWDTHYLFDKASVEQAKTLGSSMIDRLIINVVAPFVYSYGRHHQIRDYTEKALRWLQDIPPEKNKITAFWKRNMEFGNNAYESQSLIALDKHYCSQKKCLDCAVGCEIMKNIYTVQEAKENYLNSGSPHFA